METCAIQTLAGVVCGSRSEIAECPMCGNSMCQAHNSGIGKFEGSKPLCLYCACEHEAKAILERSIRELKNAASAQSGSKVMGSLQDLSDHTEWWAEKFRVAEQGVTIVEHSLIAPM